TAAVLVPFGDELRAVWRRSQGALKSRRGVVVKTKVSRRELFLEYRHPREQRQRCPLHAVRRTEPYLAFTFKNRTRNAPADVLGKGQGAVVEINMEIRPVNRGVANEVHLFPVERDRTESLVESARSLRTLRRRAGSYGERCRSQQPQNQPDHRRRAPQIWLHKPIHRGDTIDDGRRSSYSTRSSPSTIVTLPHLGRIVRISAVPVLVVIILVLLAA